MGAKTPSPSAQNRRRSLPTVHDVSTAWPFTDNAPCESNTLIEGGAPHSVDECVQDLGGHRAGQQGHELSLSKDRDRWYRVDAEIAGQLHIAADVDDSRHNVVAGLDDEAIPFVLKGP